MASYTTTYDVDNLDWVPVVTHLARSTRIVVYENARAGTTNLFLKGNLGSSQIEKLAAEKVEFVSRTVFVAGDVVGYIKAASPGVITIAQEED